MTDLLQPILTLLAGFALMIIGADRLVKGSIQIALQLNLSKAFVGAVLVGFGTSAPELFTSIFSASQGEGVLAAGNVIGSNIFNSTLVMGVCLLFPFVLTKQERSWLNWVLILLPSSLLVFFFHDLNITRFEGLILLSFLPVFFYLLIKQGSGEEDADCKNTHCGFPYVSVFWGGLGVALLYFGTNFSISSSLKIVESMGLSKSFAGTIILAAGTGLPELVTTLVAGFRKELSLALANIIGSNTLNIFGVLGASATIFPFSVPEKMAHTNGSYLLLISFFLIPLLIIKHRWFPKIWSVFLFTIYVYFLAQA